MSFAWAAFDSRSMKSSDHSNSFAKWLAFILDDLVKIPGTNRRVGLDPLIGLIPGAGEFLSSTAGFALIASSTKKNLPLSIYLRMIANWTLNALIGALPLIGDLFSFWFKSNQRNYDLLRAHFDDSYTSSKFSWLPLLILIFAAILVFTLIALLAIWSWRLIFS